MDHTDQVEFVRLMRLLSREANHNSRSKGFWHLMDELKTHPRFIEIERIWKMSRVALMHTEASEVVEGIRKDAMDDHLPHRSMEVCELADIIIRIFDYAGEYNLSLGPAILEKMTYNSQREYMHGKKA